MPPALYLHQKQFSRSRRSESVDSSRSLSSSTEQEQEMEPPLNDDSIDSEATGVSSIGRQPSDPVAASQEIPDIHPEFLESLKRRSRPHVPLRSSSLTQPPETLQEDGPPSSPIEPVPSRSRGWRQWWMGLVTGRTPSTAPIPNDVIPTDDGNNALSTEDRRSGNISNSLDSTTIPMREVPSARYSNSFSNLWIFRQIPLCPPAAHPLVFGIRCFGEWNNHRYTPLDIGCEILGGPSMFGSKPTRPPQDIEESHEDSSLDDIDDDPPNDPFGYGSDNSQHFSFHTNFRDPTFDPGASLHGQGVDIASRDYEGAKSLIELSEWRGIPVIDGIDPTASNHGSGLEPVGNPPATPRPAHRTLSFTANTLPGYQRANETRSRLISQQFAEVQLLLDLRIERRFGSLGNAAPTSLMADNKEIDGKESTSSADAAVALVAIVGGGNLATIDAIGGSVQDTLAATVQNLAANLAEDHSCSSNRLITSIEDIGKGASSSEAENTSKSTTESEDADFGSNAEGLVPLEQVWSRRPSPPQRRYSFGMIDRAE